MYSWVYRHALAHSDPEAAHRAAMRAIQAMGECAPLAEAVRATVGRAPAPTGVRIGRRTLAGRVGLAAGMDKDARAVAGLAALGFAFVEVGTLTPRPQPGNPRPRLWRIPSRDALRNHMGFNNEGAARAAERLRRLRGSRAGRRAVVGVNIGKNRATPLARAALDYRTGARALARWADFLVINVSSPNTPGLRTLQGPSALARVVDETRAGARAATPRDVPVFVKIAPDLSDAQVEATVAQLRRLGVDGIVAVNTTVDHPFGEGGVSGAPLYPRALRVVRLVARAKSPAQVLIGCGGIRTPAQARAMLRAGADALEAFTAFVTRGPLWPGHLNRALARA